VDHARCVGEVPLAPLAAWAFTAQAFTRTRTVIEDERRIRHWRHGDVEARELGVAPMLHVVEVDQKGEVAVS